MEWKKPELKKYNVEELVKNITVNAQAVDAVV